MAAIGATKTLRARPMGDKGVDKREDVSRSYDNITKAEIEAEIAKLERHLAEAKAKPARPTLKLVRT